MDRPSIHDIRLSFTFKHLWSILSVSLSHLIEKKDLKYNFDIKLQDIELTDHVIKTTIHKTDIVSVIVACILNPIPVDMFGLVKLSSSLARVEDRLQILVSEYNTTSIQSGRQNTYLLNSITRYPIACHRFSRCHFGKDALTSFGGKNFGMSWKDSLNVLHHVYSKEYEGKRRKKTKLKVRGEV
jgi:hypothetical protein